MLTNGKDGVSMKSRIDFSKYLFFTSGAALVFAYGFAVGAYGVFPADILRFGLDSLEQVWSERQTLAGIRPELHLSSAKYEGSGVTRVDPERISPGLTLLSGFFDDGNELRLIEADGTIVRRWPVLFSAIFPDPSHIEPVAARPATDWNIDIHGAQALPDGSVLFNFEYGGLVKLDRCGELDWTVPLKTHHSVELSDQGTYWVPVRRWIAGQSLHPPYPTPYHEDGLLEVSQDGRVLREISVLDIFFDNNLQALLLANGDYEVGSIHGDWFEVVHLNDIQPLSARIAEAYAAFAAGDLALSLRQFNMLLVIDPETREVKWHQTGPWIRQHDPDFLPNGRISVFNNNTDDSAGEVFGGSNIIEVDPSTGESWVRHEGVEGRSWYTEARGKHQVLANGNTLIVESYSGRAFEVTETDDLVWEFINRFDDDEVARVNDAVRYPDGYFSVEDWTCGTEGRGER